MMRKLAALLCSLILVTAVVGLVACKPKTRQWDGSFSESGEVVNARKPKTYTANRPDDRATAYRAYLENGETIGDFKGMANAINAAVAGGANSYVTRTDDTTKLFYNRPGYADKSDECFWFYDNGTSLDSFWCWDAVDTLASLRGSDLLTAHTQKQGTEATQTYYSYEVLDRTGKPATTKDASYFQLSATLDAAVFSFPVKERGMTKLTYDIDLSSVRITPAFTEGEAAYPVYAFMGFYMWAPHYVINAGIACDVKTGNWYPYIGTSRDHSASDTEYSVDKSLCVMTSTWNDAGYFVPDTKSLTMSVETKLGEDENGPYQYDDLLVRTSDNVVFTHRITDSTVNQYFSDKKLDVANMYIFVAGLDVKAPISSGVYTQNVDCFNGAKFENLAITKAEQYIPTFEELPDSDYKGGEILAEDRGKSHSMLMADGGSDLYEFTILNNNFCTSYQAVDGKDVYSFNFDQSKEHSAASSDLLGPTAKEYQDKINELSAVTAENALEYADDIMAMEKWYGTDANGTGSKIPAKYYNVLNFQPYLNARGILREVTKLDETTQAFADAFEKIQPLSSYTMKGWKAEEGTAIEGYLYSEYAAMKQLMADYDTLSSEMQKLVFYHINKTTFEDWQLFCAEMTAIMESDAYSDAGITGYAPTNDGKGDSLTVTPEKALAQIAYWMLQIKAETVWGSTESTDLGYMNYNNSYQQSEFIVICRKYLEGLGFTMPTFYRDTLADLQYEAFAKDYEALVATVRIGSFWQTQTTNMTKLIAITEEQAELLTKYWSSGWAYTDPGMVWNIKFALGSMSSRLNNTLQYYLAEGTKFTRFDECFDKIKEVLASHGYTPDSSADYPYRVTEATIEAKAGEDFNYGVLSQDGQDFIANWNKVGPFTSFEMKSWKAPEGTEDKTGYLYDTALTMPALKTLWEGLPAQDKTYIVQFTGVADEAFITAAMTEWDTFATELAALGQNSAFTDTTTVKLLDTLTNEEVDVTPEQTFALIAYWAFQIGNGGSWESNSPSGTMDSDNSWKPSVFVVTLVQHFEDLGLQLPAAIGSLLDKVKYDEFLDAYESLYQTIALAQDIKTNNRTTLSELSEQQLAALNVYWVNGYTIARILTWNWNDPAGNRFDTSWFGPRVNLVIKLAGGTLTEGGAALKCKDYFKIVADFLAANGYTVKANGWGVAEDHIEASAT